MFDKALYLQVIFSTARWRRIISVTTRKIKYEDFKPLILFGLRMQLALTKNCALYQCNAGLYSFIMLLEIC